MKTEYDAFAHDFSATRKNAWPEFEILLQNIRKNDRILDLGCGNGRLRTFLEEVIIPSGNYFGLDVSEKLLQIARENFPRDHFFHGNFAQKLPFGSDNFEIVVSIAAFHHLLNKKDQIIFLKECHRILKPGGKIFITTWKLPRKYFWHNILRGRFKNWNIPFGKEKLPRTYRRVSDKELSKLLKKTDFRVIFSKLERERNYVALGEKKVEN